jgi:HSP20 family molecular chaperone IbpA
VISGVRHEAKEGKLIVQEIKRGHFERRISLDCQVDASKVEAVFSEGVLDLTFPKINWTRVNIQQ